MSKSKAKSIRARLKKMDFDEYWERTGGYLVDICKANDFMPEMREALRRHKPEILIGVHRSKNVSPPSCEYSLPLTSLADPRRYEDAAFERLPRRG